MSKSFKLYKISCGKCEANVLSYKKFGAGKSILRLYFNHIVAPPKMVDKLNSDYQSLKEIGNLICPNCEEVLGVPDFSKGGKLVFRMRKGYFHRKWDKSNTN